MCVVTVMCMFLISCTIFNIRNGVQTLEVQEECCPLLELKMEQCRLLATLFG